MREGTTDLADEKFKLIKEYTLSKQDIASAATKCRLWINAEDVQSLQRCAKTWICTTPQFFCATPQFVCATSHLFLCRIQILCQIRMGGGNDVQWCGCATPHLFCVEFKFEQNLVQIWMGGQWCAIMRMRHAASFFVPNSNFVQIWMGGDNDVHWCGCATPHLFCAEFKFCSFFFFFEKLRRDASTPSQRWEELSHFFAIWFKTLQPLFCN